jgi:hypothetical protein
MLMSDMEHKLTQEELAAEHFRSVTDNRREEDRGD